MCIRFLLGRFSINFTLFPQNLEKVFFRLVSDEMRLVEMSLQVFQVAQLFLASDTETARTEVGMAACHMPLEKWRKLLGGPCSLELGGANLALGSFETLHS